MMNTKYIIEKSGKVRANPGAMGNAWFINKVVSVASPNEEIESLQDADLSTTAFFLQDEFKGIHLDTSYRKNGSIFLKSYNPNQLIYQSLTDTNQVAVFSEIWYGPNKGWQAYIDGKPIDHFRLNYILRGIEIPAGNHEIEFKFDPKDIESNKSISYWFGNIFGLIVLLGMGMGIKYLFSHSLNDTLALYTTQTKK
ncbi:MAG: YfhO family protein [Saprospiraceae bacterium]|nr:YfhO family protein [Saprospiraceae bacterium]